MEVECITMDTFSITSTYPSRYLESKYHVNVLSLENNQRQQQRQRILFHVKNFSHRRACRDSVRLEPARGETFVIPRLTSKFHNPYFFSDVLAFQTYYRAPSACP